MVARDSTCDELLAMTSLSFVVSAAVAQRCRVVVVVLPPFLCCSKLPARCCCGKALAGALLFVRVGTSPRVLVVF